MTVYGVDVSDYQSELLTKSVLDQGYEFVIAKCTEGRGLVQRHYPIFQAEAEAHGALFGAYHFLRSDSPTSEQAANLAAHIIDKSIPYFIDCEVSGPSRPDWNTVISFKQECDKLGLTFGGLYLPGFWYDQINGGKADLSWAQGHFWQANYGMNPQGYASATYPGDHSRRWAVQGGATPSILQFGSRGVIDGYKGDVDVNAIRVKDRAAVAALGLFKDYGAAPVPVQKRTYPLIVRALASNKAHAADLQRIKAGRARIPAALALVALKREARRLNKIIGS